MAHQKSSRTCIEHRFLAQFESHPQPASATVIREIPTAPAHTHNSFGGRAWEGNKGAANRLPRVEKSDSNERPGRCSSTKRTNLACLGSLTYCCTSATTLHSTPSSWKESVETQSIPSPIARPLNPTIRSLSRAVSLYIERDHDSLLTAFDDEAFTAQLQPSI